MFIPLHRRDNTNQAPFKGMLHEDVLGLENYPFVDALVRQGSMDHPGKELARAVGRRLLSKPQSVIPSHTDSV